MQILVPCSSGSLQALLKKEQIRLPISNMLHRAATDRLNVRRSQVICWNIFTPPDEKGYVSLSLGVTYEKDIFDVAELKILEVNKHLPRTFGDTHFTHKRGELLC